MCDKSPPTHPPHPFPAELVLPVRAEKAKGGGLLLLSQLGTKTTHHTATKFQIRWNPEMEHTQQCMRLCKRFRFITLSHQPKMIAIIFNIPFWLQAGALNYLSLAEEPAW